MAAIIPNDTAYDDAKSFTGHTTMLSNGYRPMAKVQDAVEMEVKEKVDAHGDAVSPAAEMQLKEPKVDADPPYEQIHYLTFYKHYLILHRVLQPCPQPAADGHIFAVPAPRPRMVVEEDDVDDDVIVIPAPRTCKRKDNEGTGKDKKYALYMR